MWLAGKLTDAGAGRKLSLSEAVRLGYVDDAFARQLESGCGLRDPSTGSELSLLDAMRKGWYYSLNSVFNTPACHSHSQKCSLIDGPLLPFFTLLLLGLCVSVTQS